MFKRGWRRKIEEATIGLLERGENLVVGFPAEIMKAPPTSWLVDYLRRRYRVYVVALTNSRVLVLSRVAAFSTFQPMWIEARDAVSATIPSEGRLSLRGRDLAIDLEVSGDWRAEARLVSVELGR